MKILFWVVILVAVILGSLAATHNMEVRAFQCQKCKAQKQTVEVTCMGQYLHDYDPFDTPCTAASDHQWERLFKMSERGVRAIFGRDVETPEPIPALPTP